MHHHYLQIVFSQELGREILDVVCHNQGLVHWLSTKRAFAYCTIRTIVISTARILQQNFKVNALYLLPFALHVPSSDQCTWEQSCNSDLCTGQPPRKLARGRFGCVTAAARLAAGPCLGGRADQSLPARIHFRLVSNTCISIGTHCCRYPRQDQKHTIAKCCSIHVATEATLTQKPNSANVIDTLMH